MIVVGSANMDVVVRVARAPGPGETISGQGYANYPGGKGANQAVAARRAGAAVAFAVCLGRDAHGDALHDALLREGIDLAGASRVEAPTGTAFITVEASGENRIIIIPGANAELTPDRLPPMPHGVLLMQLEIDMQTVTEAALRMRRAGGIVILNPAPALAMPPRLLEAVDIILANETEAGQILGGKPPAKPDEAREAARRLAEGRRAAIITLGAAGAVWAGSEGEGHVGGHRVSVIDTTACGDAFAGAFAQAIEAGAPLNAAVARGNAAGALAATIEGAQPSLPPRAAVDRLLVVHT